ncbi:hypothetical protein AA0488_2629 [Kozakia baliensis NRIC 0488]|uniref:Uncharacterized protein n=1 Tax=Kozakia baliensis TaxID=153496 RepID=A0A1D8UXU1_9PROT|nr:hypothetical protein [Kozakia baliensis]AOX18432.1 hypothetical protein A0U89_14040 [Kozakia baliensis]GBR32874.1 hypothetical protein AA0488_2629 [Kozakia baliensis NRIC 0488]
MSEEGMGGWAGYMLGRASAEQDAFMARQRQIIHRMFNRPPDDDGHEALKREALRACDVIDRLDAKLDEVKAQLAAEKERTAQLEAELAAERERSAKLYRDRERSAALYLEAAAKRRRDYENRQ